MEQTRPQLRVVTPDNLTAAEKKADEERASVKATPIVDTSLAGHIRTEFSTYKRHRDSASGWSQRLTAALQAFNGQYSAEKLQEIKKFGGSEVYARLIAAKCRGASSLLRDVYLSSERPWGLDPAEDPDLPPEVMQKVEELVASEATTLALNGQMPDMTVIRDRTIQLLDGAKQAAKKRARKQAEMATDKMDEYLQQGGFYEALAAFLQDLTIFPFACLKGPVVRVVQSVTWKGGKAIMSDVPRLFWERVSPFDIWWAPGVSNISDGPVIQRSRVTRKDLNDLLDLPGYRHDEIRAVLDEYGAGGLNEDWDSADAERAKLENREDPFFNRSGLISMLEYHGAVQGAKLLGYGMKPGEIPDPSRDYFVQAWLIGQHIIKVQMQPSPRKRPPYYVSSFEKVPSTPVGNGLPDILADVQDVMNATLRALVNNLSIASGPQVVINEDRLSPNENADELYPWKRWRCMTDINGNNAQVPVSFFQPVSNAQELLAVYEKFNTIGDELSAIPRYMSGSSPGSGAGRTASGLAMLMGNASKILQTVAANVDADVLEMVLLDLYDMVMLTDRSGVFSGQEQVRVLGVAVATQRETQRVRQLEFLQATANPIDMSIIGPRGRANVLRAVSQTIGLDGDKIVPSDDDLDKQQQAAEQQAQLTGQPGFAPGPDNNANAKVAQGNQPAQQTTQDMGPRTRLAGGVG
jgi:hypothetical protein